MSEIEVVTIDKDFTKRLKEIRRQLKMMSFPPKPRRLMLTRLLGIAFRNKWKFDYRLLWNTKTGSRYLFLSFLYFQISFPLWKKEWKGSEQ